MYLRAEGVGLRGLQMPIKGEELLDAEFAWMIPAYTCMAKRPTLDGQSVPSSLFVLHWETKLIGRRQQVFGLVPRLFQHGRQPQASGGSHQGQQSNI